MANELAQRSQIPSTAFANSVEAAIKGGLVFPKSEARVAADATATLLGSYPNGKPADPKTYSAAVVAVLMQYPPEVVRKVTDPVHGVARRVSFLPTVKEITDACETEMIPLRNAWRAEKEAKERERHRRETKVVDQKVVAGFESLVADLSKGLAP